MPFTLRDLLSGVVLAVVPLVLTLAAARIGRHAALKYLLPLFIAAGFVLGYWLLELGPMQPRFDRHWLAYVPLLALVPAFSVGGSRFALAVTLMLSCATSSLAAWLLMPAWESIKPDRLQYGMLWGVYTLGVSVALLLVARRTSSTQTLSAQPGKPAHDLGSLLFLATMLSALGAGFVVLALGGSLRFARMAAVGMAALAGVTVGLWLSKAWPALEGMALVYALLITSLLLTGYVNSHSNIGLPVYLILPLVPLAHAFTPHANPAEPLTMKQLLAPACVALVTLGIGLGWAIIVYETT